jgi:hypothetical protein
LRADYLKTFFAGYLAASGFIVTLFKADARGEQISGDVLFGVAILIIIVFCFAGIFYVLILRLNMVLLRYRNVLIQTHLHFFGSSSAFAKIWRFEETSFGPNKKTFYSTSGSIPYLIMLLSGCLIPAEFWIASVLIRKPYFFIWRPSLLFFVCMVMGMGLLWIYQQGKQAVAQNAKELPRLAE